jgi:hypothetical protein
LHDDIRRDSANFTRAPVVEINRVFRHISCSKGHKDEELRAEESWGIECDGDGGVSEMDGEHVKLEISLSVIVTPATVNFIRDAVVTSRH